MQMQVVRMQESPDNGTSQRKIAIGIAIGQYHFVTADGWKEEWRTMTPREWWAKQQWLKDGGYAQDEN